MQSAISRSRTRRYKHCFLTAVTAIILAAFISAGTKSNAAEAASPPSLLAAVLPSSRSVSVGTPATAFATIINAGGETAIGCTIAPTTVLPISFLFQTTDPSTNALTGMPNTPTDIPPAAAKTFLIAASPSSGIVTTNLALTFSCANATPAPVGIGLNTLLLSASTGPSPDIVALVATINNNGIVEIPGNTGVGAFAVATVNVGGSGAITASFDTGGTELPLALSLCQTVPATGECMSEIAPSVVTTIVTRETPTFAIFAAGGGPIPFAPATSRIYVRFRDDTGATRGSTSVAVRTSNPGVVASFAELTPAVFSNLSPTTIQHGTRDPNKQFFLPYGFPRTYGYGNLLRNHRNDLVVAPNFFTTGPELPIEIWGNTGDGSFTNRTSDVLADTVTTQNVNNVFVSDLNGDGIDDIFIVDAGYEVLPGQPAPGSRNKLLLSGPDGKLHDASATLPVQYNAFNHVSAMADLNADGCPDFVITELGNAILSHTGVYVLMNDCRGHFSKVTSTLPIEIVEKDQSSFQYSPNIDYQNPYHAAAADLNGDGAVDLISGTGGFGDVNGREKTIRIFDGGNSFNQVARFTLPPALRALPNFSEMGVVGFAFGDLDGDGKTDIVAAIETATSMKTYVVIYKNLGNFSFADVTLQYLPDYETTFVDPATNSNVLTHSIKTLQVRLDSFVDVALGCFQVFVPGGGKCLYLNPGGQTLVPWGFTRRGQPATAQDIATAAPDASFACPFHPGIPLFFDVDGDGVKDIVMISGSCTDNSVPAQTNRLQVIVYRSGVRP